MTKIQLSPSADAELVEMLTYIAQRNRQNALNFITGLEEKIRKVLTTLPESGKPHRGGARYLTVLQRVVVYEYDKPSDTVSILHFYGKGEDWK